MAPKATVFKVSLDVCDVDRNHYATYPLTLAKHPSETEERMMIGLAAFALNAHERLEFTRGLSETDEPDLWRRDLTGELELWVELGHPDPQRLAKACGRSRAVKVYTYSRQPLLWWEGASAKLERFRNLSVFSLDPAETEKLSAFIDKGMDISATIQDGELWIRDGEGREARLGINTLKG